MGDAAKPPKPSLREVQREATRARIVDAALTVFDREGFIQATMDDVATEAAISRPTIYAHFDNKASILRAAMARMPKFKPMVEAIISARDRAQRLAGFQALNAWWLEHLAPVYPHVHAAAAVDDEISEWIRSYVRWPTDMLTDKLVEDGMRREVAEPRAFMIVCLWAEVGFRMGTMGRHLDPDSSVQALTDLFEAALSPPAPSRSV